MNEISSGIITMESFAQLGRVLGSAFCLCMATLAVAQTPGATPSAATPSSASRVAIPGNLFASLEKGRPSGVFIEAVDAILKKSGITPTYINMPTGDALRDLNEGNISAATVVVPIPRIKDAAWFSDPVVTEYNVAVTLKDKGFNLTRVFDLRGKKIGARAGYQYPLLEKDRGIRLLRYRTDGEMLRSLFFGHVDVAVIAGISDIYAFRSEGIMTRMEILKTSVGAVPLVVAFSRKHFSKESVDAFNQALASFKKGPEWREILEKNGMTDLIRDWPLVTE